MWEWRTGDSVLAMSILNRIAALFAPTPRPSHYLWHPVSPVLPVRLTDGKLNGPGGQIWRRRTRAGEWEYRQDEEDPEEFWDRKI